MASNPSPRRRRRQPLRGPRSTPPRRAAKSRAPSGRSASTRRATAVSALAADGAAGDHRPRADRDGGRQRRRRRLHLRPGRPELRHEPALGAAAAGARADRQPGDGRQAGCRHRHRPRQADHRAVRPAVGMVPDELPVPAELPHHRHGVHRGQSGARLSGRLAVHLGADRGDGADRRDGQRQLPLLGALDVPVRVREPAGVPLFFMAHPNFGNIVHHFFVPASTVAAIRPPCCC